MAAEHFVHATHTHTQAIAQAAITRSTRHIHRHNHRIRITGYISSTPSSRHTHGRAAAAQERKDQHGAAPSPSQSSSPVVESLESADRWDRGKQCNERERDGAQRIQRERADNMRKRQQAQPHSSHTTRRQPPPSPPSSFLLPQGNGQNPAATTQRTRSKHPPHEAEAEAEPHPSMTRQQNFLPSRPQWNTEPNSTQSHAVHHTRRKGDSGCALPLLPSHGNERRQQPPHATASTRYKRSFQIHCNVHFVCVVVCACSNTKQRRKKGAEYVEGSTKIYSGGAWRKQLEEDHSNS
ncbi:hypothetical protein TCDM_12253 [Trypanosoma cruzi Dm28c]|uniref:Uncharacterized protein n=1 Tax=Trypanosoma cruzi Dm28c TaxID=1416333 RepID=V5B4X1_TRYCR|nr:hypothetical protein TCDM_12253 [Trypanosoma cruzi Dm28c]